MTDDDKLAKLQIFEDQAWKDLNNEFHEIDEDEACIKIIERCQNIRANLERSIFESRRATLEQTVSKMSNQ